MAASTGGSFLLTPPACRPIWDDVGRDFARCIKACNTARRACVDAQKDCKQVRKAIENGESPNRP